MYVIVSLPLREAAGDREPGQLRSTSAHLRRRPRPSPPRQGVNAPTLARLRGVGRPVPPAATATTRSGSGRPDPREIDGPWLATLPNLRRSAWRRPRLRSSRYAVSVLSCSCSFSQLFLVRFLYIFFVFFVDAARATTARLFARVLGADALQSSQSEVVVQGRRG